MGDEAIVIIILGMDTDLKSQTNPGLPASRASSHGNEVTAKQEGIEDFLSLLICPKSKTIKMYWWIQDNNTFGRMKVLENIEIFTRF